MSPRSIAVACVAGALLPLVWIGGCNRCQKDDPPPPLPTSTSDAASEPVETVLEAGSDVVDATDADADAKPPKKGGAPTSGLKPCCDALASNAENAPEPTKSYMKTAAAACHSAVAQGQDKNAILSVIRSTLRGAGLPASCK